MKLLKRTADSSKKQVVLITGEAGLLPLAGAVGIYVAKNLQSKPEIPQAPASLPKHDEDEEEQLDLASDKKLDKSRPISEYAPAAGLANNEEDEAVTLDNTAPAAAAGAKAAKNGGKGKKDKKLRIPDFNKFRLWIILGCSGLVLLIFFWYMGFKVMPRATVTIETDSTAVESSFQLTFDTEADSVSVDEGIVPAKSQQTQKSATQQVEATGQKDNGTKASGEVTLSLEDCTKDQVTVPAGATLISNSLVFVTQKSVTLTSVSEKVGSVVKCKNSSNPEYSTAAVAVIAQNAGAQYNLAAGETYSVSGYSNVSGEGDAMSGGTSNIVKIISQSDIDSAKQKIAAQDSTAIESELAEALESQDYYAVTDTFTSADPEITTSGNVGDEAETVTVTTKTTYTMLGAKESDLEKLIANEVNQEIDTDKQQILDYGLSDATFRLQNQQDTQSLVDLSVSSVVGTDIDLTDVKQKIAGKKANDAKSIIGNYPGVTDVQVKYSPFWVSSIPGNTSKIEVIIEEPTTQNAD